jgi:fatty-acyl-CoA synthase
VEHLLLLAACTRLGATLVPLNWRLAPPELARVLANAGPTLLYTGAAEQTLAEQALARVRDVHAPRLRVLPTTPPPRAASSPRHDVQAVSGHVADRAPAMLLYTSGTTGEPKGVIVPHAQLHWNAAGTVSAWRLHSEHVALVMSPFFHTAGWGVFALPLLSVGAQLVLLPTFDADLAVDALEACRITHTFGVPTQWQDLVASPRWGRALPHLAWMLTGGAPCPRSVHDAVVAAGYDFREGFGLTECGPNCFVTTAERARRHPGVVGDPLPMLEARLVREDGTIVTAPDTPGELQLRGPQLFGGYWQNAAATAEVMTADGWLCTGDMLSAEPHVGFRVRGRRKEMFISGGENVFPGEVEAALLATGLVREACVMGVPDARWGEVGAACVVPAPDVPFDAPALQRALREWLAGYKVPQRMRSVAELPRLGSGKVNRAAVAALLQDGA